MQQLLASRTLWRLCALSIINILLLSVAVMTGTLHLTTTVTFSQRSNVVLQLGKTDALPPPPPPKPTMLLCMFTSFNPDPRKTAANNNTLHNWPALNSDKTNPRVRPILYFGRPGTPSTAEDEAMTMLAKRLGWTVLPIPRVSRIGLPFFKAMYHEARKQFPDCLFYGFANGDIIFDNGLIASLDAVAEKLDTLNRTMVIGRRWNVRWRNMTLYRPDQVTQIAKRYGRVATLMAEDYFFVAKNDFPWRKLPDVVIARRGYDNYVVMMAVREQVSVIDATRTMVAVHQTDSQHSDRHRHTKDHEFNMYKTGRFNAGKGMISSSQYFTRLVYNQLEGKKVIDISKRSRPTARQLPKQTYQKIMFNTLTGARLRIQPLKQAYQRMPGLRRPPWHIPYPGPVISGAFESDRLKNKTQQAHGRMSNTLGSGRLRIQQPKQTYRRMFDNNLSEHPSPMPTAGSGAGDTSQQQV